MKKLVLFVFVTLFAVALAPQTANAQTEKKVAKEKVAPQKAKKGDVVPIDQKDRYVKKKSVEKTATKPEDRNAAKRERRGTIAPPTKKPAEAVVKPVKSKDTKNKKAKKLERVKKKDN